MNPQTALKQITDVSIEDNGKAVAFRVITQNDKSLEVSLPRHALHEFIENLIQIAQGAARVRTKGVPVSLSTSPPTTFSGNQATALGIGEATDRKTMFLILRLHDFDLTFQVEKSILPGLADSFAQAVKAIDADENVRH